MALVPPGDPAKRPAYTCAHSAPYRCYDHTGSGFATHFHANASGHHHAHRDAHPDADPDASDDPLADADPDAGTDP